MKSLQCVSQHEDLKCNDESGVHTGHNRLADTIVCENTRLSNDFGFHDNIFGDTGFKTTITVSVGLEETNDGKDHPRDLKIVLTQKFCCHRRGLLSEIEVLPWLTIR